MLRAPETDRTARLDRALASVATDGSGYETASVLSFVAGALYSGIGVFVAMNPDQQPRDSGMRAILVTENLVLGGICFGAGAYATVDRLGRLLVLSLADLAWVRVQGSFAADELSEPEPDVCIFPFGDYDAAHPSEAHLIIEVSDSSLAYDRGEKARLYAACGVPEYWVVNLVERVVEAHRGPAANGYREVTPVPKGERLRLLAFPDVELAVDAFLR